MSCVCGVLVASCSSFGGQMPCYSMLVSWSPQEAALPLPYPHRTHKTLHSQRKWSVYERHERKASNAILPDVWLQSTELLCRAIRNCSLRESANLQNQAKKCMRRFFRTRLRPRRRAGSWRQENPLCPCHSRCARVSRAADARSGLQNASAAPRRSAYKAHR